MQKDWGARASSPAAFGVSPKAFDPGEGSPKGDSFGTQSQSAGHQNKLSGRRWRVGQLEATETVALPFFNYMDTAEDSRKNSFCPIVAIPRLSPTH
jgi:hypothetical protein